MFELLTRTFPVTGREECDLDLAGIPTVLHGVFDSMAGVTLAEGFYRFHTPESARRGSEACARLIDGFEGRFHSFAFDLFGRELAADLRPGRDAVVIAVDPGGGEYLRTDTPLAEWHDVVAGEEDPLAYPYYRQWRAANPDAGPLAFDQVIGYRVPLFLGGEDEITNLEVYPREVYFELCTQLARGARSMPVGTTIDQVIADRGGS